MRSAILFWWCVSTPQKKCLICSNHVFFESLSIGGTTLGMVFFNLCNKSCCILFKFVFFFDSFICYGAFTELYISQFRKMVKKYCGNVIFSTYLPSFENWDQSVLRRFNFIDWNEYSWLIMFICNTRSWNICIRICTTFFSKTAYWTSWNFFLSDCR